MSTSTSRSGSQRPPTPKSSDVGSDDQVGIPPLPKTISGRNSTSSTHPPRRSSLGFLRRSKSGDPVRKQPVVAPAPPKLPNLWANGSTTSTGFSNHLLTKDVRDSVDILSGNIHELPRGDTGDNRQPSANTANGNGGYVPGRKSTDSAIGADPEYVKTSCVPISQDPYANIGSMAHRGRYSYASSAVSTIHSPRRVRRRKDPTPFNIMIVGAKNSGKTSFLRFLRQSLALKNKSDESLLPDTDHTGTTAESAFKSTYLETEIDNERIGLTLWDSAGLEKNLIDLQIRETVAFIENKFEETFSEETKVVRAPGVRDTHIHCVFLLLDPARLSPNNHYLGKASSANEDGGLDQDLDLSVLEALQGKTIVVPVISKADTCTTKHMEHLKNLVREGFAKARMDPLEALELEIDGDDDESEEERPAARRTQNPLANVVEASDEADGDLEADGNRSSEDDNYMDDPIEVDDDELEPHAVTDSPEEEAQPESHPITAGLSFIPLSIISPDSYDPDLPLGRHFPWGFADPYNEAHCDFVRLKDSVFSEWRGELRDRSRINWYENWRSERLGRDRKGRGTRRY